MYDYDRRKVAASKAEEEGYRALEKAGIRVFRGGKVTRVYDPRKRGGYLILKGGYHNSSKPGKELVSVESFGASGAFNTQVRKVLEAEGLL